MQIKKSFSANSIANMGNSMAAETKNVMETIGASIASTGFHLGSDLIVYFSLDTAKDLIAEWERKINLPEEKIVGSCKSSLYTTNDQEFYLLKIESNKFVPDAEYQADIFAFRYQKFLEAESLSASNLTKFNKDSILCKYEFTFLLNYYLKYISVLIDQYNIKRTPSNLEQYLPKELSEIVRTYLAGDKFRIKNLSLIPADKVDKVLLTMSDFSLVTSNIEKMPEHMVIVKEGMKDKNLLKNMHKLLSKFSIGSQKIKFV